MNWKEVEKLFLNNQEWFNTLGFIKSHVHNISIYRTSLLSVEMEILLEYFTPPKFLDLFYIPSFCMKNIYRTIFEEISKTQLTDLDAVPRRA